MTESMEDILWRTVETTAQRILVDVELVFHKPGFLRLLRLWHRPSFGAESSWTVLVPPDRGDDEVPVAIELVWERPRDYESIFTPRSVGALPGPTIRMREAFVPKAELAGLLARAPLFGLPPGAPVSAPSDAEIESWGLEAHGSGAILHLEWSDAGPDAWTPNTRWADRLRELIVYCFDPWVPESAIDEGAIRARRGLQTEEQRGDEVEFGLWTCPSCRAVHISSTVYGSYTSLHPDPEDLARVVAEDRFECACAAREPPRLDPANDAPEGRPHPTSATWRDLLRSNLLWAVRPDSIPAYFNPPSIP